MRSKRRSGLLYVLIECTLMLFLFALSAAVCVSMQAHAHEMNEEVSIRHSVMRESSSILDAIECAQLDELGYAWQMISPKVYQSTSIETGNQRIEITYEDTSHTKGTLRMFDADETWIELPFVVGQEVSR